MSSAQALPGIWGQIEAKAAEAPAGVEGGGRLWRRLSDMVDITQFRPKLAEHVEMKDFTTRWGATYTMIANTRDLIHYRYETSDAEMVRMMDGTRTVKEILVSRFQESGELVASNLADLVYGLYVGNFLDRPYVDVDDMIRRAADPRAGLRSRVRESLRTLTVEWHNADRPVRWLYEHGVKHLLNKWVTIAGSAITIAGLALFVVVVGQHRFGLSGKSLAVGFLILFVLNYFTTFVHELGHAVFVVKNGRRIPSAGFQIYFGSPAFFVDSSDALMMDRRQRILQAWGGPFAEMVVGGIVSILVWAYPESSVAPILYKFAALNWFVVFLNLIPLLELDGYFILSDAIDVPDLRPLSLAFVQHELPGKLRRRERFSKRDVGLALYGIFGILFTAVSFFWAYFFWKEVFGGVVARLWKGGTTTRILLFALLVVVAMPALRGLFRLGRSAYKRLQAVLLQIRFRFERSWRVEAAGLIDALPLFDDLPEDALSDLAGRVKLRSFRPRQAVFRQGERAGAFYVVRRGTLEVVEEFPDTSSERTLRVLGKGESFGELGLAENALRTATVRTATDAQLFEIDKGTFDRLLADTLHLPEFAPTVQEAGELKELPCFSHLEADELSVLLEFGEWVNIAPGEVVIEEGQVGDSFYAIGSGQVEVEKDGETVRSLGPGRFFGEVALLLDVPRTATVRARTPVRAFRLDRPGFDRVIADAFTKGTVNPTVLLERR